MFLSSVTAYGPKLATALKNLPAGRFIHLAALAVGTYVIAKKAVATVRGEISS